jgi:aspartate kinase
MGEVCVTLKNVPEDVDLALIFGMLSKSAINIDMIVQITMSHLNSKDVSFSLSAKDLRFALEILESAKAEMQYEGLFWKDALAKVSIVGVAMKYHAGVAAEMFKIIEDLGVKIYAVTTSEIKISVLLDEQDCRVVANALHSAFALDQIVEAIDL